MKNLWIILSNVLGIYEKAVDNIIKYTGNLRETTVYLEMAETGNLQNCQN